MPRISRSRVYHQMRDRLMRGIFKPHQRLRIGELSQAFGTSETPIREAIFQLIRDGAVEAKPHSYYRVRKLSVGEYLERREIQNGRASWRERCGVEGANFVVAGCGKKKNNKM